MSFMAFSRTLDIRFYVRRKWIGMTIVSHIIICVYLSIFDYYQHFSWETDSQYKRAIKRVTCSFIYQIAVTLSSSFIVA